MPVALPMALEILHAGSLVVDDIQDGSSHRRGSPAGEAEKEAFVLMPEATTLPNVAELDPRVPDPVEEEAAPERA